MEVCRTLHLHVRCQRLPQPGGEHVGLMLACQVVATAHECQELALVPLDGACALQFLDFAHHSWLSWPKVVVHVLFLYASGWCPTIKNGTKKELGLS
jgi:hypothetical protein